MLWFCYNPIPESVVFANDRWKNSISARGNQRVTAHCVSVTNGLVLRDKATSHLDGPGARSDVLHAGAVFTRLVRSEVSNDWPL